MSVRYDATRTRWVADSYDETGKRAHVRDWIIQTCPRSSGG